MDLLWKMASGRLAEWQKSISKGGGVENQKHCQICTTAGMSSARPVGARAAVAWLCSTNVNSRPPLQGSTGLIGPEAHQSGPVRASPGPSTAPVPAREGVPRRWFQVPSGYLSGAGGHRVRGCALCKHAKPAPLVAPLAPGTINAEGPFIPRHALVPIGQARATATVWEGGAKIEGAAPGEMLYYKLLHRAVST